MKRLKLFFACLLMAVLSIGQMWATEQTITLTYSSFGLTTSYASKDATVDGFDFTVNQGYKGSENVIQMNSSKGSGALYNTSAISGLKSIKVNVSSGNKTYTITTGTSQNPTANSQTGTTGGTYNATSGDTYFQLKVSGASYFSSIEITYDDGQGGEDPDPVEPTISTDPVDANYVVGASATALTVEATASAGDLHYQWYSNTTESTEGASTVGTDAASYTPSTTSAGTTYYYCVVTDDNGSATSGFAAVKVSEPTGTFALFSGDLVEGDYVIYYSGKALKNTVSSSRFDYLEVTPANDKLTNPDEAIIWHIAASGGYWTIYNAAVKKYAAGTGTKNQGGLLDSGSDDKSLWTVSGSSTYEFVNKKNTASSVNANLRNNGTNGFACYSTQTGGALTLYKKQLPAHELTFGVASSGHGSLAASVGGSAINSGAQVAEGATVTLTPTADTYYQVSAVTVLDGEAAEVTTTENAGVYTFAMPTSDAEAEVSFEYIPVTSVSVDATLELVEGETHTLSATVLPNTALGTVEWESDETDVATVDANGKVTAVSAGSANITATSTVTGSKYGTCAVTVSAPTGNPITISQNTGGTVAADVEIADVLAGVPVTLTATPADGYSVNEWTIVGVEAEDLTISEDKTTCSFAMPESEVLAEASFTHETATLKLVELGVENAFDSENTHYWKESVTLPGLSGLGCSDKVFRGWSTESGCNTAPTLKAGDSYTLPNAGENKLYAVFATEDEGTPATWQLTSADITKIGSGSGYAPYNGEREKSGITFTTSDVMVGTGDNANKIQLKANAGIIYNKTAFDADIVSIVVTDVNVGVFEGESEISSTPSSGAISATGSGPYTYTFSSGKRYFHLKKNSSGAGYVTSITVNLKGESSYSAYTTSCEAQLPTLAAPTFGTEEGVFFVDSKNITINGPEGASIYYTINGDDPTSASTPYDAVNGITLNAYGEYTIKAIAVKAGNNDSEVASATYSIGTVFASVSDLYTYLSDNSLTSLNNVKVTGLVSRITTAWDAQKGFLTYYISDNGQTTNDLQMYRGAGAGADVLAVGDQVTVTGNYTLFQSTTHEFGAGNTIVARTAATISSVAIGGAVEKTTYSPEDNQFSHTGLTATATYNTGYTKDVTALATWTNNLENNTVAASGNVEVTATYEGESDTKEVAVTYTSKTLDHITLSYSSTTAYVGMALPTPTVTASYVEDIEDEDVTALVAAASGFDTESAYDGTATGSYIINVSYTLGEVTKSAEYTVTVKSIYNDESDPYTVAEALDIIGANFSTTTSTDSIVVAGIVSRLDGTYVNTYWISDDGNTNNELEVYSGKYLNKVAFTAANQLHVGDVVVVKGKVKTYQSTKEFDSNSRLVSLARTPNFEVADVAEALEVNISEDLGVEGLTITKDGEGEVTLVSSDETKVSIVNGKLHAVAAAENVEITANLAASGIYKAATTTFHVSVIAERTRYTVTFDKNGGTGTDPEAIANQLAGATVDMPTSTPLYNKEGHAFTGWKVINLSTEAEIEVENDQFEMPAANVKIQAQWAVVATCAISFQVGDQVVTTANAPQEADYNISQVGTAVPGFTFLGWSETEYADEVETAPTLINVYHAQAGEETKTLYGIYSRLEDNGNQHYVLDYQADGVGDQITASYGNAVNITATDGGQWVVKAYKNAGMQINTGKNGSIKVPSCPGNIVSIGITCSIAKSVGFSASDYSGSGTITYVVSGTDATSQTLDFAGEEVKDGYIVPKGGSTAITHIDVEYSSAKTYYTSSPVEKVTVTFALAGGEGGCQTTKINKGSEFTICAEVPTKSHSEFAGWKNGDDVYVAGTAYTFDADITLTAQWNEAATYTVTYNVNGSEDAAPTIDAQYAGDQFAVADGVTKEGYTFKGWLYNNKLYKAGAQFTMPAANVEFVANWKKNNIATEKMLLISDANGLSNGMAIALGCSYGEDNFAMAGDIPSGKAYLDYVSGENITLNNGLATFTEDVITMIAEQVEGGWTLRKDETHYLTLTGTDVKWDTQDKATAWTISFSNGNVQIASGNNKMQFNSNSPRFKTYTSNQTAIQLFGKATVVTNDAKISDLGYEEEGLNIVASGDITLTIDEPTNAQSITATNGATVKINKPTTAKSVNVEEGSKIEANEPTTTPVVTFATTLGSSNTPSTGSALGSADNITLAAGGEIHYDITLGVDMTTDAGKEKAADQWHAFTVPFPCDALNGIYNAETGAKLANEVDYAIMDYHGDIRADGQYGWKKYRGTLVPGKFYLMTINGDVATFRFKMSVAAATVLQALKSMAYTAYGVTDPENTTSDQGWNGIGNPSWVSVTVSYPVQVLDPYGYEYQTLPAGTVISASTPFFYKANATSTMTMTESNANAQYAPRRTPANEIKNMAVRFGNEVFADKLYVTASEDALNSYEQDKDLVKMTMSKTPKVAQIFGDAYGMKLSMVNTPLVNNNAEVALTLYAPEAGEYTISVPEMENAEIYLTKDGAIIWNLTMSEYTNDFAKGNNEGYGLLLIKKITGISTGVENIEAAEAGVQKVVIDDKVFILRGEKMYDVTGKMVK